MKKLAIYFLLFILILSFSPLLIQKTQATPNIAVIPDFWTNTNGWSIDEYCRYPVSFDGKNCIEMLPNPSYISYAQSHGWMGLNEVNGFPNNKPVPVKPGDHVVFKAWIWTESATVSGGGGEYMLVDAYGSGGRICELRGANGVPDYSVYRLLVNWGSGKWVQLTMDFIIQDSYMREGTTTYVVPTGIIPVLQLLHFTSYTETAGAYIYGTELYINPSLPSDYPPSYTTIATALTVNSPNGGETWVRGTTHTLTWSYSGSPGAYVKVELMKSGVLNRVITYSTANDGSYSWTIPSTQTLGTDYKIRVSSTSNPAITDSSNSNFAIVAGTLTVTIPNGGQSWKRGTVHTITWSKSGSPGSYVKIEFLKGGVVNRVITSSTANDGSYSWTIPSTQTVGTDYKIRITSTAYSSISDSSNSNFYITT